MERFRHTELNYTFRMSFASVQTANQSCTDYFP